MSAVPIQVHTLEQLYAPQAGLTFTDEPHEYRLHGKVIPSCTQILRDVGIVNFDHIKPEVLDYAADRGTTVHDATLAWEDNDLNEDGLTTEERWYLDGYIAFFEHEKPITLLREQPRYGCGYGGMSYGYKLDRAWMWRDKPTIGEIKTTSKIERHHGLQLASHAAGTPLPDEMNHPMPFTATARVRMWQRIVLHLAPDATYKVEVFSDPTDYLIFEAALGITYWKGRKK